MAKCEEKGCDREVAGTGVPVCTRCMTSNSKSLSGGGKDLDSVLGSLKEADMKSEPKPEAASPGVVAKLYSNSIRGTQYVVDGTVFSFDDSGMASIGADALITAKNLLKLRPGRFRIELVETKPSTQELVQKAFEAMGLDKKESEESPVDPEPEKAVEEEKATASEAEPQPEAGTERPAAKEAVPVKKVAKKVVKKASKKASSKVTRRGRPAKNKVTPKGA